MSQCAGFLDGETKTVDSLLLHYVFISHKHLFAFVKKNVFENSSSYSCVNLLSFHLMSTSVNTIIL